MRNDVNELFVENSVKLLLADFQKWGINNFSQWLERYDDTFEQILGIVEGYVDKVTREDWGSIEDWERIVMLNSVALYMVELDINFIPEGNLRNEILYRFVQTIRIYSFVKKGLFKLNGQILISNTNNCEFIKQ